MNSVAVVFGERCIQLNLMRESICTIVGIVYLVWNSTLDGNLISILST